MSSGRRSMSSAPFSPSFRCASPTANYASSVPSVRTRASRAARGIRWASSCIPRRTIKYCLPNGEHGIVRTLDSPVYVTAVRGTSVHVLDREWQPRVWSMDNTEYMFKLALERKQYKEVVRIIQSDRLVGESIIAYLLKKDFAEGALYFNQDPKTKFMLAIECGNIEIARECAAELDDRESWLKLGKQALRQGMHKVVEHCFIKSESLDRLSFLYLISGNTNNLQKMMNHSLAHGEPMTQFTNSLYLGDVESRIDILKSIGHHQLAYLTAKTHGLDEQAAALEEELGEHVPKLPDLSNASLMLPPVPVLRDDSWPTLELPKGVLAAEFKHAEAEARAQRKSLEASSDAFDLEETRVSDAAQAAGGDAWKWGDDDLNLSAGEAGKSEGGSDLGWSEGEDDFFGGEEAPQTEEIQDGGDFFMPNVGSSARQQWMQSSPCPADIVAAGAFDIAMESLHRQLGIAHFAPLKPFHPNIPKRAPSDANATQHDDL
eukprot:664706_1